MIFTFDFTINFHFLQFHSWKLLSHFGVFRKKTMVTYSTSLVATHQSWGHSLHCLWGLFLHPSCCDSFKPSSCGGTIFSSKEKFDVNSTFHIFHWSLFQGSTIIKLDKFILIHNFTHNNLYYLLWRGFIIMDTFYFFCPFKEHNISTLDDLFGFYTHQAICFGPFIIP